jgi:hypothetical protein
VAFPLVPLDEFPQALRQFGQLQIGPPAQLVRDQAMGLQLLVPAPPQEQACGPKAGWSGWVSQIKPSSSQSRQVMEVFPCWTGRTATGRGLAGEHPEMVFVASVLTGVDVYPHCSHWFALLAQDRFAVAFLFQSDCQLRFFCRGFPMAKTRIASADLVWVVRERLSIIDDRFKVAPIAIVPTVDGWEALTSRRYRKAQPRIDGCIARIQAELRPIYRLPRD